MKSRAGTGEDHPRAKLTKRKVDQICKLLVRGWTCNKLGKMFGVTSDSISNINCDITWRMVPRPSDWKTRPKLGKRSRARTTFPVYLNMLTDFEVRKAITLLVQRRSHRDIADIIGTGKPTIDNIALDRAYLHVSRPPDWHRRVQRVHRRTRPPFTPRNPRRVT